MVCVSACAVCFLYLCPLVSHIVHADSWCLFKYDFRANVLWHFEQTKFLSAECVCMCARKLDLSANALPQCAQPYGFSPVCDRRWPCNSHGLLNCFPQIPQLCASLCVSKCMASAGMLTYTLPQVLHFFADWESKLRCVCLCRERLLEVAYCLPHSPQT